MHALPLSRLMLGAVAIAVLAVAGFVGAYVATRPTAEPQTATTADTEKKPAPEPKSEVKVEPKIEPKADPEIDRRRDAFTQLMINAGIASQFKKYDEAIAAYTEATGLFPDNTDAQRKLAEARAALEAAEKARRDQQAIETETAALLKRGQDALDREKIPAAIEFFRLALQKAPTNDEAAQKLLLAQNQLQKLEADQKALETFDQHILAGKAALKAGRSADAIREFLSANKVRPNDQLPVDLLREAEKQLAQVKNEDDRKKQFQNLLDQGNAFLRIKNNQDAEDAFRQALKLMPNDPVAQRGLDATLAAAKKGKAEVTNLLQQAQTALAAGQLQTALVYLRDAERIQPANPELVRALRAAQLIQANQAAYFGAINRASAAMALFRYGDAIVAYSDALLIVPNDPLASVGLLEAQRGLVIYNRKKRDYDILVNQGVQSLQAQRYGEAARSFEAAAKVARPPLLPDPQVQILTRYAEAMHQGMAAANARQFPQAVQFFQAALVEVPNDIAAQSALQKARVGFKGKF